MGTRDRQEPDGWRHNAGFTPCSARASMTTRRHTYCRLRILTLCRGDFLVMPNDDVPVLGHGFGSHTGPQYWSKIAFTLVIPLSSSRVDAPSMRPLPVTRPLNVGIHHEHGCWESHHAKLGKVFSTVFPRPPRWACRTHSGEIDEYVNASTRLSGRHTPEHHRNDRGSVPVQQ